MHYEALFHTLSECQREYNEILNRIRNAPRNAAATVEVENWVERGHRCAEEARDAALQLIAAGIKVIQRQLDGTVTIEDCTSDDSQRLFEDRIRTLYAAVQSHGSVFPKAGPDPLRALSRGEWGWYSKYLSKDNSVHLLLDKDGRPTTNYPHVHVIYDDGKSRTIIVVTERAGHHSYKYVVTGPDRNLDGEIEKALAILRALEI